LGIAFQNQTRMISRKKPSKFGLLVTRNLITEKDLNQASVSARELRKSMENVLMEDFKIPKDEIGKCLSEYYHCEFYKYPEGTIIPDFLIKNLNLDGGKPHVGISVWEWENFHGAEAAEKGQRIFLPKTGG
jgi:hypothetical protein